jgi:hypothetical protein
VSILEERVDRPRRERLLFRVGGPLALGEAAESGVGTYPERAAAVFTERRHDVAQDVSMAENGRLRLSLGPGPDEAALRADPETPPSVHEDRADVAIGQRPALEPTVREELKTISVGPDPDTFAAWRQRADAPVHEA